MRSILALAAIVCALPACAQPGKTRTVVFVCEHGSAKSVIAAAHFNRIAESKGLPYRAISRGVHPDAEIPAAIKAGLLADGLDVSTWKPKLIGDDDIRQAERVITLACALPKSKSITEGKVVDWDNLPTMNGGYPDLRTAIVQRIEDLLKTLPASR